MKVKTKFKITFMLILISFLIVSSAMRIEKYIDNYSQVILKNTVCSHINNTISNYIAANEDKFSHISTSFYNNNGELVCISIDTATFNNIRTELEQSLLGAISDIEEMPFCVKIGNLTGIKLLSGTGPSIEFKIVPLGTLSCDTINQFNSVGINHTAHKVGLSFTVNFRAAAPFGSSTFQANFEVTICESIIIGQVPEVYFN